MAVVQASTGQSVAHSASTTDQSARGYEVRVTQAPRRGHSLCHATGCLSEWAGIPSPRVCCNRTTEMGHTNADIDRFLHLLRRNKGSARDLSAALRALSIPRSTYYYWKRQLAGAADSPAGVVRRLQQECRRLTTRVTQLEEDLAVAREALGKPWRRWPPGGPPSGGR
jgi:hypothetical protein